VRHHAKDMPLTYEQQVSRAGRINLWAY